MIKVNAIAMTYSEVENGSGTRFVTVSGRTAILLVSVDLGVEQVTLRPEAVTLAGTSPSENFGEISASDE